jgi:hypothetical protein
MPSLLLSVSELAKSLSEINRILSQFSLIALLASIDAFSELLVSKHSVPRIDGRWKTIQTYKCNFLASEHTLYDAPSSSEFIIHSFRKALQVFQGYAKTPQKATIITRMSFVRHRPPCLGSLPRIDPHTTAIITP